MRSPRSRRASARAERHKTSYSEHLKTLACQHIGLKQQFVSEIKRKLAPAHQELSDRGFLESVTYESMRTAPGEVKVVYRFPVRRRRSVSLTPAPADPVVERLVAAGIAPQTAAKLVRDKPDSCLAQLDYHPYREKLTNPAGAPGEFALVRSTKPRWAGKTGRDRPIGPLLAAPGTAMIPRSQFDTLLSDIQRAIGCATIGGLVAGYDLLLGGLKRAEYARLEGEAWAPALVDRYRQAIAEYQSFYGLRFD